MGKIFKRGAVWYYVDSAGKRRSLQTRSHAEALRRAVEIDGAAPAASAPAVSAPAPKAPPSVSVSSVAPDPLSEVGSSGESEASGPRSAAPEGGDVDPVGGDDGPVFGGGPSPGQIEIAKKMAWAMAAISMTFTGVFVRRVLKREPGAVSEPTAEALASSWEPITAEWAQSEYVGPWAIVGASLIAVAIEQASGGKPLGAVPESEGAGGAQ